MKYIISFILLNVLFGCSVIPQHDTELRIAFGSCTNQARANQLWKEIAQTKPDAFIFTGDAVYPEIYDIGHLEKAYQIQTKNQDFIDLKKQTTIFGVYDDHDYGLNDGGKENEIKSDAKNLFVEYMIDQDFARKNELKNNPNGLFYVENYPNFDTKIIVLDTRYNRTSLKKSDNPNLRYQPIQNGEILGEAQWNFLKQTIQNAQEKNIIIVSSIQFLNEFHGYEKWGNIISEKQKMLNLIEENPRHQFIFISGDRHFSEISKLNNIWEITSSGLTEVATMAEESNPLRQSDMIKTPNFGLLKISSKGIRVELIGEENQVILRKNISS